MKSIFFSNTYDLNKVFKLLFKRFKIVNCEVFSEAVKSDIIKDKECFCISNFATDQKPEFKQIDVYEIALALSIYLKCDFKEKMNLIFDLTDVDSDGYISEQEIKNMIFTVNFIFSDEESPVRSKSSVINQSLSNIKTQQIFEMILNHVK